MEARPFSWWGYCLITLGIVTSAVMGILIYHKWGDTTAGCFVNNNFCINALMAYKSNGTSVSKELPMTSSTFAISYWFVQNIKPCCLKQL